MPGVFRSSINLTRWRGAVPNALNAGRVDAFIGAGAVADVQAGLAREATLVATTNTVNTINTNTAGYLPAIYSGVNGIAANGAQQSTLSATQGTVNATQGTVNATQGTVNAIWNQITGPGSDVNVRVHNGDLNIPNGASTGVSNLPYAVNLARAFLIKLTYGNVDDLRFWPSHATSAGTSSQVHASRSSASGDANVAYTVVEFL